MSIEKFKFWCHKVLPLVYDDSLSYYELLCKVVKKINEVIDSENEVQALIGQADSRLTELEADVAEVQGDVEDVTTRLATAEDELTSLYTRVGTVEGDIVDIRTDVRNLETISVEALTRANAAKTSVEALETTVEGIQGDIDNLETRTDTAEGDIDSLETRMGTAEGDIDSLESRMNTAEGDIDNLEAAVAEADKLYVDARTLEGDYEIPAPTKQYGNLRYYFTDDGSSSYNVTLSTAFVNYIKSTGRKVELFVGASGTGYVTVNLSSISSLFKTYSIEGRGIQTSISSQYGAQKIVLIWDEDEFDWSMVEAELKDVHDLALDTQMVANSLNNTVNTPTTGLVDRVTALENAGGGGKYLHRAHIRLKFQTIGELPDYIPFEFINESSTTYGTPNQFIEAWRASFGLNLQNTIKSFIGTYLISSGQQNIWLRIYLGNSPLIKALSFAVDKSTGAWGSSDMGIVDWWLHNQSVVAL